MSQKADKLGGFNRPKRHPSRLLVPKAGNPLGLGPGVGEGGSPGLSVPLFQRPQRAQRFQLPPKDRHRLLHCKRIKHADGKYTFTQPVPANLNKEPPFPFVFEDRITRPKDPLYDANCPPIRVLKEIPIKELKTTIGAICMLPVNNTVCFRMTKEEKDKGAQRAKNTQFEHLFGVSKHAAYLAEGGITPATYSYSLVVDKAFDLISEPGNVTFTEWHLDKVTFNIIRGVDSMLLARDIPPNLKRPLLFLVFSLYFVVTQDIESKNFPKEPANQETKGNEYMKSKSTKEAEELMEWAEMCRQAPLSYLKETTLKLFFGKMDFSKAIPLEISNNWLCLARAYERCEMSQGPILSTIRAATLDGRHGAAIDCLRAMYDENVATVILYGQGLSS